MAIDFDNTEENRDRPFATQEGPGEVVEIMIPDENEKHIPGSVALIGDGLNEEDENGARQLAHRETRALIETPVDSSDFQKTVDRITKVAEREMAQMGSAPSRLLERNLKEMKDGGGASKKVSGSLLALRQEIDGIQGNNAKGITKLLRKLPGGNKAEEMLLRYESAQDTLNAVVDSLSRGRADLEADSATLLSEMDDIKGNAYKLAEWIEFMDATKEEIEKEISALSRSSKTADQERAEILRSKVLFKVNQRRQDLRTQFAVALAAHKTMELIVNNNEQLAEGVERANAVIVPVLRTGLITGSALQTQDEIGRVLDSMSEVADSMMRDHADTMAKHTHDIHRRATSSMVKAETIEYTLNKVAQIEEEMVKFQLEASDVINKSIGNMDKALGRTGAKALIAGKSSEDRALVSGSLPKGSAAGVPQGSPAESPFRS